MRLLLGALAIAAAIALIRIGDPADEAARVRTAREQKIEEATQALRATPEAEPVPEPEPASEAIAAEPFRDTDPASVRFGVCVLAYGRPQRDAEVLFELALPANADSARSLRGRTDDRGYVTFDVPAATASAAEAAIAYASIPGFVAKSASHEGPFRDSRCEMLLALDAGRTIRGRVVDLHGEGLGGVSVSAGLRPVPTGQKRRAKPAAGAANARSITERLLDPLHGETDEQGRFELGPVAGSTCSLSLRKHGFVFGDDDGQVPGTAAGEIFVVAEPVYVGRLAVRVDGQPAGEMLASIRLPVTGLSDSSWRIIDEAAVIPNAPSYADFARQSGIHGSYKLLLKRRAAVAIGQLRQLRPGWQGSGREDEATDSVPVEIERFRGPVADARVPVVPLLEAGRAPSTEIDLPRIGLRKLTLRAPWLRGLPDGKLAIALAGEQSEFRELQVPVDAGDGSLLLPEGSYRILPGISGRRVYVASFRPGLADLVEADAIVELPLAPGWHYVQVQPRTLDGDGVSGFHVYEGGAGWSERAVPIASGRAGVAHLFCRRSVGTLVITAPGFRRRTFSFAVPPPADGDGLSDPDAASGAPRVVLTPTLLPLN